MLFAISSLEVISKKYRIYFFKDIINDEHLLFGFVSCSRLILLSLYLPFSSIGVFLALKANPLFPWKALLYFITNVLCFTPGKIGSLSTLCSTRNGLLEIFTIVWKEKYLLKIDLKNIRRNVSCWVVTSDRNYVSVFFC